MTDKLIHLASLILKEAQSLGASYAQCTEGLSFFQNQ